MTDVNAAIQNVADALESQPDKKKPEQESKRDSFLGDGLDDEPAKGDAKDPEDKGKPADKNTDDDKKQSKSVPMERFQAKNRQLALMQMENDALKAAAKVNKTPEPKGDDDDEEDGQQGIKSEMTDVAAIVREEIQKSMGGFTTVLAQQAETRDIDDVRRVFGDDFNEVEDLPEIKKIQEIHPTLSAEHAFRMLQSYRGEPGQQEAKARANTNVSLNNGRQNNSLPSMVDADVPDDVKRIVDSANEGIRNPKRKLNYAKYYANYLERTGGQQ